MRLNIPMGCLPRQSRSRLGALATIAVAAVALPASAITIIIDDFTQIQSSTTDATDVNFGPVTQSLLAGSGVSSLFGVGAGTATATERTTDGAGTFGFSEVDINLQPFNQDNLQFSLPNTDGSGTATYTFLDGAGLAGGTLDLSSLLLSNPSFIIDAIAAAPLNPDPLNVGDYLQSLDVVVVSATGTESVESLPAGSPAGGLISQSLSIPFSSFVATDFGSVTSIGIRASDTSINGFDVTLNSFAVAVPEPSRAVLIGLGCFGLLMRRSRK